ncbi:MAG TPA: glycosyltransferase family 2 protein [Puia sp.]|jgi:glycosyltransferase involved in cell wall biosynthesis|nr:glycosyltransferase family 2 protein [Puia sp.]
MSLPFFSIIIPTFNSDRYIRACLESIRNQTFERYEILVIDGVSTDGTVETVEKMAAEWPRLVFVSEKDNGIYDAMNKGIAKARGQWLYFLGSNDRLFDNSVLQSVAGFLESNTCEVVYGNVLLENSGNVYAGEFDTDKIYTINISHQAIFFNKTVFTLTGPFDLQYRSNADWDHNFKWFFHPGIQKRYIDRVIAVYSEDGFSSVYVDEAFRGKKEELYLDRAGKKASRQLRSRLFRIMAVRKKDSGNKLGFLWYALKHFLYKFPPKGGPKS